MVYSAHPREAQHGSQSTANALSNATATRPIVQTGPKRAPLTRVSSAARGPPAPSVPRHVRPSYCLRSRARRATKGGRLEPRPHVARVGRLGPRRPAAADPVRAGSRGGACRARRNRPARKSFAFDGTSQVFQRVVWRREGSERGVRRARGGQEVKCGWYCCCYCCPNQPRGGSRRGILMLWS